MPISTTLPAASSTAAPDRAAAPGRPKQSPILPEGHSAYLASGEPS